MQIVGRQDFADEDGGVGERQEYSGDQRHLVGA
jgi:hypothetical protein